MSILRTCLPLCASVFLPLLFPPWTAAKQTSSPATQPAVPYTSVNELNGILEQVKQTAENMQADLERTRIDRWKTDSKTKRETQATVESIQRNLQSSLPETIAQLNNAPEDLGGSFKLYRNLVLLYDSFSQVMENAGAFGSKDEFQALSNDMNGLENARRSFGQRVQKLASAKEDELARLRVQVRTLQAAPPPPPKKIVVDDTEPPKKPATKKKPKPAKPAGTTPPASTPPANTPPGI
jgi:hypothetical protein